MPLIYLHKRKGVVNATAAPLFGETRRGGIVTNGRKLELSQRVKGNTAEWKVSRLPQPESVFTPSENAGREAVVWAAGTVETSAALVLKRVTVPKP
jgi:hypothetical protein